MTAPSLRVGSRASDYSIMPHSLHLLALSGELSCTAGERAEPMAGSSHPSMWTVGWCLGLYSRMLYARLKPTGMCMLAGRCARDACAPPVTEAGPTRHAAQGEL